MDAALLDACEQTVRKARGCALTKLYNDSLSRAARQVVVEALVRRGLERIGNKLRVPVREQLASLVSGEPVPLRNLKRRLVGCTDREVKAALSEGSELWIVVKRGKDPNLVARSEAVLSEIELAEMAAVAKELAALARSVKPRPGSAPISLWRTDLTAVLNRAAAWRPPPSRVAREGAARDAPVRKDAPREAPEPEGVAREAPVRKEAPREAPARERAAHEPHAREGAARARTARDPGTVTERVLQGLRRAADRQTGLASVPHVLRALSPSVATDEAHEALLELAGAGHIELRPDSGVELLAPELRAWCPAGPRGSILSYARVLTMSA